MNKKFIVRLTDDERSRLSVMTTTGRASAFSIKHANIVLKADADGPAWTDNKIAESFSCSINAVANTRQRLVETGIEAALQRRPQVRPSRLAILDGEKEAKLIALCCSKPPEGRARWTLQLLADRLVALKIVDTISDETVRVSLKKMNCVRISRNAG